MLIIEINQLTIGFESNSYFYLFIMKMTKSYLSPMWIRRRCHSATNALG